MSVITANQNFLASLGITDATTFLASFETLSDFDSYCEAIGYDYELDENDAIILINPDGKHIDTGIILQTTATPTISYDSNTRKVTVTGNGTILGYVDGTLVPMPHVLPENENDTTYLITATAQEEGKLISLVASLEVTVLGIVDPDPQDPPEPEPHEETGE